MCRGWEQMSELALASALSFPAEMWPVSAPGGADSAAPALGLRRPTALGVLL